MDEKKKYLDDALDGCGSVLKRNQQSKYDLYAILSVDSENEPDIKLSYIPAINKKEAMEIYVKEEELSDFKIKHWWILRCHKVELDGWAIRPDPLAEKKERCVTYDDLEWDNDFKSDPYFNDECDPSDSDDD